MTKWRATTRSCLVVLIMFYITIEFPLAAIFENVYRKMGWDFLYYLRMHYLGWVVFFSITMLWLAFRKWDYNRDTHIKVMRVSFSLFVLSALFILTHTVLFFFALLGLSSGLSVGVSAINLAMASRNEEETAGYLIVHAIPVCGLVGGSLGFMSAVLGGSGSPFPIVRIALTSLGEPGFYFVLPCLFLMLFSVVVIRVKGKVSVRNIFLHPYALTAVICALCLIGWPFFLSSHAFLFEKDKANFLMLFSTSCLTVAVITCGLFYLSFKTWIFDIQVKKIFRYGSFGVLFLACITLLSLPATRSFSTLLKYRDFISETTGLSALSIFCYGFVISMSTLYCVVANREPHLSAKQRFYNSAPMIFTCGVVPLCAFLLVV